MIVSPESFGADYVTALENERARLRNIYGQDFTYVFDQTVGAFLFISDDETIKQTFYTDETPVTFYPPDPSTPNPIPSKPNTARLGFGVLRIEHIGLPQGYYPTTAIEGLSDTISIAKNNGFDDIDKTLLDRYPDDVRYAIENNFPHLGSNRVSGGLPNLIYPNQSTVQVELPMGGPLRFGYKISTQPIVSTNQGNFRYVVPWEGTTNGEQLLLNPSPNLLYTIRIRWISVDTPRPQDPPRPSPVEPLPPPIILQAKPIIPSTGLNPEFIPSTEPQLPPPGPLPNPTVNLTRPYTIPELTFRARAVSQMYGAAPILSTLKWTYDIGKPPTFVPIEYKFRNNTLNAVLRFEFELPEWIETNVSDTVDVSPLSEISVLFRFKESYAREKSITNIREFTQQLKWKVEPINLTGPVLVRYGSPGIVVTNTITNQDTGISNPPQPVIIRDQNNNQIILDDTAKIYTQLNPTRISLQVGQRVPIQLFSFIGLPDITPNETNAKKLFFPTNGVVWESLNENVAVIESPNGSINATLVGINPGILEVRAKTVSRPTNIEEPIWLRAYRNGVVGTKVTVSDNSIIASAVVSVVSPQ